MEGESSNEAESETRERLRKALAREGIRVHLQYDRNIKCKNASPGPHS